MSDVTINDIHAAKVGKLSRERLEVLKVVDLRHLASETGLVRNAGKLKRTDLIDALMTAQGNIAASSAANESITSKPEPTTVEDQATAELGAKLSEVASGAPVTGDGSQGFLQKAQSEDQLPESLRTRALASSHAGVPLIPTFKEVPPFAPKSVDATAEHDTKLEDLAARDAGNVNADEPPLRLAQVVRFPTSKTRGSLPPSERQQEDQLLTRHYKPDGAEEAPVKHFPLGAEGSRVYVSNPLLVDCSLCQEYLTAPDGLTLEDRNHQTQTLRKYAQSIAKAQSTGVKWALEKALDYIVHKGITSLATALSLGCRDNTEDLKTCEALVKAQLLATASSEVRAQASQKHRWLSWADGILAVTEEQWQAAGLVVFQQEASILLKLVIGNLDQALAGNA